MKTNDLVTVNQAARIKGVSRQSIHAAIRDGRLKAIEVPAVTYRVSLSDLKLTSFSRTGGRKPKAQK